MQRFAMKELINWKNKRNRKPLIIMGARQVGKTWLMKEFGKTYYSKTAYISSEHFRLCACIRILICSSQEK